MDRIGEELNEIWYIHPAERYMQLWKEWEKSLWTDVEYFPVFNE